MTTENNLPINTEDIPQPSVDSGSGGCGMIIIFVVAVIWILITTLAAQMLGWSVEQAIFEGSLGIPDIRWLVALVYGLALFLPRSEEHTSELQSHC